MLSRRQILYAPAVLAGRQRPNFLVLLTDDQRFDTIGALGNREVRTPNMDRLVRSGVAFTLSSTQGGLTGAICMPSRAQLLTGRSVFHVHRGIIGRQNAPDPSLAAFPELLRRAGYVTFGTGKWHNGRPLYQRSFSAGGSVFFGGMADHLKTPVSDYDPSGEYPNSKTRTAEKFSSELFADSAVEFLERGDKTQPFLLYLAFTSPHDPRMAPERFAGQYPPERIALPPSFMPQHPFDNGEMKVRDELLAAFPRTPEEIRRHIAAYYAMISEVDHQIGRVLDALERSGEAARTYVIFAGDNGLAVGRHGLLGKQNLYDHSIRVPLVIAGPGIPKGRRAESLCQLMDLCPTICDLAGIPAPSGIEARSLKPALDDPRAPLRDSTVYAYRNFQRAIRTDRWKLILYNVKGVRTTQLFDLREDPHELKNLAGEPSQAARVRELAALLQNRLTEAGDTVRLEAAKW